MDSEKHRLNGNNQEEVHDFSALTKGSVCRLLKAMDGIQLLLVLDLFLFQIIVRLQAKPEFSTCSKKFGKTECCVSSYPTFIPKDFTDPGLWEKGFFRQTIGRDTKGYEELFFEYFPGMNVHDLFFH